MQNEREHIESLNNEVESESIQLEYFLDKL
jgi:hypothetical protein